jgi:hypothetical protein
MATHQISPLEIGFVDKRRTTRAGNGSETMADAFLNATKSQDDMDTALLAAAYTQAQIDHMTTNDKVYALRLALDPNGI